MSRQEEFLKDLQEILNKHKAEIQFGIGVTPEVYLYSAVDKNENWLWGEYFELPTSIIFTE